MDLSDKTSDDFSGQNDISTELGYSNKRDLMIEFEELAEMEGFRNFARFGTEFSVPSEVILKLDNKAEQQAVDASVMELQGAIDSVESDVGTLQSDLSTLTSSVGDLLTDLTALDGVVLKKEGSVALTGDWDIGNGRMIQADKIRARDSDGLALFEDGGAGIFVRDGGDVGIGTITPYNGNGGLVLHVEGPGFPTIKVKNIDTIKGAFFQQFNDTDKYLAVGTYGSANVSGALFGVARANNGFAFSTNKMTIGTVGAYDLTFGTNLTANVTIKSGGNVGIGTTTPSAKLAINGGLHVGGDSDPGDNNILVDGNVEIDGDLNHDGSYVGFYGTAPVAQHAAIADATDAASTITQLNLALAALRRLGLIAT